MVCFIILHYNSIKDTERCIASIMKMNEVKDSRIVIVDNASPNQTGRILAEKYAACEWIDVMLRKSNDGFSVGNNDGYCYAKRKWDPDFVVVTNNDIEFCQKDFIERIKNEYKCSYFAILGPDIYVPLNKVHQSPMAKKPPSKSRVGVTILLNQLVLSIYPIIYPLIKEYFRRMEACAQSQSYEVYQEDVCLMGACLIYSKEYMNARDKIFEPETRFYYEENIQTLWCIYNKKKIVYQPNIMVYHMQGKATKTVDTRQKDRIKFRVKNILSSARVYKKFLLEMKKEENI
ncbi:glycosyltransferase [bacterium C-53]|nr:glycosyltransferase [Lachnospiraceae bacterium]NBI02652.1 glycosyltransferase [Lachnospiraceae bacterium]RKJ11291.1 glycosyltransferase [bacterium C-53]